MRQTKPTAKRKIVRRLSKDGWIVEVPVTDQTNGPKAIVEMSVFSDLIGKGLYPILKIEPHGYIMAWSPVYRKHTRLARLIVNANSEQEVSTIDGVELNLHRNNLQIINPPPPKPITYARDGFLSTELGILDDAVDWEWQMDVQPVSKSDEQTLAMAAYSKKMIDYQHQINKGT
jgi:hypothetical protein